MMLPPTLQRDSSKINVTSTPDCLCLLMFCYRNHKILGEKARQVTRFVALAKVGNPEKRKVCRCRGGIEFLMSTNYNLIQVAWTANGLLLVEKYHDLFHII